VYPKRTLLSAKPDPHCIGEGFSEPGEVKPLAAEGGSSHGESPQGVPRPSVCIAQAKCESSAELQKLRFVRDKVERELRDAKEGAGNPIEC
jgi:hypothetical protein